MIVSVNERRLKNEWISKNYDNTEDFCNSEHIKLTVSVYVRIKKRYPHE
jgi:hypothetical protein